MTLSRLDGAVLHAERNEDELEHPTQLALALWKADKSSFRALFKTSCKTRFALLAYDYLASCSERLRREPAGWSCAVCSALRTLGIRHRRCSTQPEAEGHMG